MDSVDHHYFAVAASVAAKTIFASGQTILDLGVAHCSESVSIAVLAPWLVSLSSAVFCPSPRSSSSIWLDPFTRD